MRETTKRRIQRQRVQALIAEWRRKHAIDPRWPYLADIRQMRGSALRLYRARGLGAADHQMQFGPGANPAGPEPFVSSQAGS